MTAKVENHCMMMRNRSITVNGKEKVCLNCEWYEQYFRRNRGNVATWVPTDCGYCLLKGRRRKPMGRPCGNFGLEA